MRQDAVFGPGEPLSQRVIAETLGASFDRILTLEAHLHRIRKLSQVFPCSARSLSSAPALGDSESVLRTIGEFLGDPIATASTRQLITVMFLVTLYLMVFKPGA